MISRHWFAGGMTWHDLVALSVDLEGVFGWLYVLRLFLAAAF